MEKIEFTKLRAMRDNNRAAIAKKMSTINSNRVEIARLSGEKKAAVLAGDMSKTHQAQFSIDSLELNNTNLHNEIEALRAVKIDQATANAAWNADFENNSDIKDEFKFIELGRGVYRLLSYIARQDYSEWISLAGAFGSVTGLRDPAPADPSGHLYLGEMNPLGATRDVVENSSFDPAAIDKLIAMLQDIKDKGISSVLDTLEA